MAGLSRSLRAATIKVGGGCKACVLAGAINSVWFAGSHRAGSGVGVSPLNQARQRTQKNAPLLAALNGSAFSIHRKAEPVHKSVPVVGAPASGSVPGHISGSFVPGAIVG